MKRLYLRSITLRTMGEAALGGSRVTRLAGNLFKEERLPSGIEISLGKASWMPIYNRNL